MRTLLISILLLFIGQVSWTQCTPIDCSASLPAYGGICDTILLTGQVNTAYTDFESFVITGNCFSATILDPTAPNVPIRITNADSFSFLGLPAGLTAGFNASSYMPPIGGYLLGCVAINGTPYEAGIFSAQAAFLLDVEFFLFGTCSGGGTAQLDNPYTYGLQLEIKPDAGFSGLNSQYCSSDPSSTLVPVTAGGTFSGPGINGNTFNPATAGNGTHTITYTVSVQQGSAIAPSTNTSTMMVTVSTQSTWYADADGDGYGDPNSSVQTCSAPGGHVSNGQDCNDNDSAINPGATEVCDNVDNNCNGAIDEGLPVNTYYADTDNDGYGTPNTSISTCDATPPTGYAANSQDCDDNDSAINPGATEVCDNVDNNCNGMVDDGLPVNTYYADTDNDGYGTPNITISTCAAAPPTGYSTNSQDCDDTNGNINPGATDIPNNGIDEDCDGMDATTTNNEDIEKIVLTIVPNPSSGWITIQADQPLISTLQVIDISGKVRLEVNDFETNSQLNLTTLSVGVYLLKATDDKGIATVRNISIVR